MVGLLLVGVTTFGLTLRPVSIRDVATIVVQSGDNMLCDGNSVVLIVLEHVDL